MGIDGLVIQEDEINFGMYMGQTDSEHKIKPASHWRDELVTRDNTKDIISLPNLIRYWQRSTGT